MLTPPKQILRVTITLDIEVDDGPDRPAAAPLREAAADYVERCLAFPVSDNSWLGLRVVGGNLKVAGRDGLTFRNLLL